MQLFLCCFLFVMKEEPSWCVDVLRSELLLVLQACVTADAVLHKGWGFHCAWKAEICSD
jgi:hypothetical protein